MSRVLVTGMAGTGKSSALAELGRRGYRVVDTDEPGWREYREYLEPIDELHRGEWLWLEEKMDRLLDADPWGTLFVAGGVRNQAAFYDRFDAVVLLSTAPEVLIERVARRRTNDYGKTPIERAEILADLIEVEPLLRASCTHELDASRPLEEIVAELIAIAGDNSGMPNDVRPDRRRSIYLAGVRVDMTTRDGVDVRIAGADLARRVQSALKACGAPEPASVAMVLTDDEELAELNREHMGVDGPTDVLSFPMLPPEVFPRRPQEARPEPGAERTHVGDIAISVERAIEQAEQGRGGQTGDVRWSAADELRLLVTHGTLHLCGWDHAEAAEETAMRDLERRLLMRDESKSGP